MLQHQPASDLVLDVEVSMADVVLGQNFLSQEVEVLGQQALLSDQPGHAQAGVHLGSVSTEARLSQAEHNYMPRQGKWTDATCAFSNPRLGTLGIAGEHTKNSIQ